MLAELRMFLRVARAADAEVVSRGDELHELDAVREPSLGRDEGVGTFGWVAAQREHVVDAVVAEAVENRTQFAGGRVDACQVGHRLDVQLVANARDEVDGALADRSARAVRHGDERRRQLPKVRDRLEELAHAVVCLRGKNSNEKVG